MKCWNQLSVICSGNVSIRKQFTFNGTRYSVTGKTESEVERKIQNKKQALERENEPTVSQWVDTFLDVYKVNVSDKTRYDYSLVLNHVRSDRKLSDIKPIDLQKMFNLHKDKSKSFIHKLKILTHELFETARSNGYIKNNPMDAVNVPKGYTNHRRALTEEERRNVMELCKTDKRRNFILLMLQCGLRPSETTYIQGKDINKSDRLLHVRGTKTEAADRFIPIPEPLFSMIKDYSGDRYVICTKPLISSLESYRKCRQHRQLHRSAPAPWSEGKRQVCEPGERVAEYTVGCRKMLMKLQLLTIPPADMVVLCKTVGISTISAVFACR